MPNTITLYDLTNTFFEGSGRFNEHAAYGYSKERRSDCPLVTLAQVLDGSGFSRKSRIFAGNVSEPSTLQKMIEDLCEDVEKKEKRGSQCELKREQLSTVVMDAGMASQQNIDWLVAQGYPYIVVIRERHREFDATQAVVVKDHLHDAVCAQRVAIVDRFSNRFAQELEPPGCRCHVG